MANYGKKNHRRAFDGNFNDYDVRIFHNFTFFENLNGKTFFH